MKDLPLRARVVVRTLNMKISRRRLADFVKTLHQKACRTCSTIIFPHSTNQIIDLWRCRRQILNSLLFHKENTLSWYCNTWMLKLSPKKTKIIIFQRCKRKCDSSFYICNEKNRHCPKLHQPRNLIHWKLYSLTRPSTTEGPPSPLQFGTKNWFQKSKTFTCMQNLRLNDLANSNLQQWSLGYLKFC